MSIIVKDKQFHLQTKNKSYIFSVYKERFLTHIYWGDKLSDDIDVSDFPDEMIISRANAFHVPLDAENKSFVSDLQLEFAVTGSGDYRTPSFLARYADGSTVTELVYDSYKIHQGKTKIPGMPSLVCENSETLEITLFDKLTGLTAKLYYCVLPEYDIITRFASFQNGGNDDIHILSAQSACVDFYGQNYKIMNLQGDWARERSVEYTDVKHGIFTINSKRGMSSHMNNPFTAIMDKNANEDYGEVFGFCLVYSGNFDASIEGSSCGTTRVTMGINPYNFDWTLAPGNEFFTPEVIMVHSNAGLSEMSRTYHKTFRECLYQGEHKMKERPLIINNWEGTTFYFDEPKLCAIAENGAKLGLEMFVLDDGWFGKRNNDDCSLGDWYLNKEKLPAGLASLAEKINGMGMKFGLWVEPEMISPDSDLYRAHPDWCLHAEGRTRTQNRQQLVLDYTRKDVRDYIIDAIGSVIASANIEYIKWDCNRNLTEMQNQMQAHEYVLGLYEVLEALTSRFPHVLFEGCSGGGGRFDAGMMYYMPQTWTSDNTDPMARIKIQYGTSMVFPPIAMTAHVGSIDVGYERENAKMNTCAMVAMSGNFGYELDLSKLSETEIKQAKGYADLYKEIRKTIQFGDFYRLENPYESDVCSFEFVDDTRVVLFTYQTFCKTNGEERRVKFKGLDKDAKYDDNGTIRTGEELMKLGRRIEIFSREQTSRCYIFNRIAE